MGNTQAVNELRANAESVMDDILTQLLDMKETLEAEAVALGIEHYPVGDGRCRCSRGWPCNTAQDIEDAYYNTQEGR